MSNNEVLGTVQCPECGGQASVMQTRRRGGYLYTKCVQCGLDQRTGKAVQNRIWHGCTWKPAVDPMHHRPACVVDGWQPDLETEQRVLVDDWQPGELTEQQTEPEPVKPVKSGSGAGRALVALGVFVLGIVGLSKVIK